MNQQHRVLFVLSSAVAFLTLGFGLNASADAITNLRQVAPGIYAGANPIDGPAGESAFRDLVNRSVKTVIDLQGTDVSEAPDILTRIYNEVHEKGERPEMIQAERSLALKAKMTFVNLPINSNNPISDEEVMRIDEVLALLTNATADSPVYLHCEHGADRTGLIVALFRVLKQGIAIDQANEEWTRFGHKDTARVFTTELDRYFCERVASSGPSSMCESFQ